MADKYKWGLVTMLPDGHRIFPEDHTPDDGISARIAIADDSGREPQDTDDGVMWLDFARNLAIVSEGGHEMFYIPLINDKDDESRTISNASALLVLSDLLEWPIEDRASGAIYSVTEEGK